MTNKTYKTYRTYIFFFIFYFLFFIFPAPAQAADNPPQLNPFCFTKDECQNPPYKGTPSPFEAPECRNQDERYKRAGYLHYCYAPQPIINLQVSIGGYKVQGIGEYIKRLYTYFVGISGIVATLMIIWAGIKWLTAGGAPDRITDAKKKIANAAVGLCLLLGSYVILQTINPDLVNLKMPPIKIPRQELLGVTLCAKRSELECGKKYQCDDTYLIGRGILPCSGSVYRGECIGQSCSGVGGTGECSKIESGKILSVDDAGDGHDLLAGYRALMSNLLHTADLSYDEIGDRINISSTDAKDFVEQAGRSFDIPGGEGWVCVNSAYLASCQFGCGSLITSETIPPPVEDLQKLVACASDSCSCVIGYRYAPSAPNELIPSCRKPLRAPSGTGTGAVSEAEDIPCSEDRNCAPATPRTLGVCNTSVDLCGPSIAHTTCNRDTECASGICNKGYSFDQCAPDGGETERGAPCYRRRDCKSPLVCNIIYFLGVGGAGECWEDPGPEGAQCREDDDCQSGDCNMWAMGTPRCN